MCAVAIGGCNMAGRFVDDDSPLGQFLLSEGCNAIAANIIGEGYDSSDFVNAAGLAALERTADVERRKDPSSDATKTAQTFLLLAKGANFLMCLNTAAQKCSERWVAQARVAVSTEAAGNSDHQGTNGTESRTSVPPQWAPSFDCTKATLLAERLICSTEALSRADMTMASLYRQQFRLTNDTLALRDEQLDWLYHQRNTCRDVACLLTAYQIRIRQLQ
jgi:hypothetical protein